MNTYQGEPRSLWIYDESLLASSHVSFDLISFVNAVSWFQSVAQTWKIRSRYPQQDRERKARLLAFADYLQNRTVPLLKSELLSQVTQERPPQPITLPLVPEDQIRQWQEDLRPVFGRNMRTAGRLASLLQKFNRMMHGHPLRVAAVGGDSAVVSFAIVVPQQLQRLVVLDASYPVRLLENMDTGITPITGFENIKDWTDVQITIDKGPSGRDPISTNFTECARWAIAKINQYPATDPVLILTFKDRPDAEDLEEDERREYRKRETRLVEAFRRALVDAGVEHPERVQFLTFGNETSLSDYKHIPHVIFLGILHRSRTDLMGAILGQSANLLRPLHEGDVKESSLGEQAHGIYQGLSRGTCRTMINGKAKAMTVDLRHYDPHSLWEALKLVMPGAVPTLPSLPAVQEDAVKILGALSKIQQGGRDSVSVRALKPLAGLEYLDSMAYTRAVTRALEVQGSSLLPLELQEAREWQRHDRTLVRLLEDDEAAPNTTDNIAALADIFATEE